MDTVDAGGHRVAYERRGEGPPVVLLHGYVGDRRMWRSQIDGLSDEFTVVAWDAPGYGGSSDPHEDFPLSAFADCLAAFIDALDWDGHTWSGCRSVEGSRSSCSGDIRRSRRASCSRRPTRAGPDRCRAS